MNFKIQKSYWQQDITCRDYLLLYTKGVAITSLLSLVFYNSVWALLPLSLIFYFYVKREKSDLLVKKKSVWMLQFQNGIQSIAAALRVGYSLENAITEARKDLAKMYQEGSPILRELDYMCAQLKVRIPVEQVLEELAGRTKDEEARNFATVCAMAKRSGGDMVGVIHRAVSRISQKIDIERQMDTLIAAKRLEFQIMSVIPIAMLGYMRLSFPEFMQVLYGNLAGIMFMSICLLAYLGAYVYGCKISRPEV